MVAVEAGQDLQLPQPQVQQEVPAVVEELGQEAELLAATAIPRQHHHLKEITVELVEIGVLITTCKVVVVVVLQRLVETVEWL
jgi:hypothetical protein